MLLIFSGYFDFYDYGIDLYCLNTKKWNVIQNQLLLMIDNCYIYIYIYIYN